MKTNTQKILEEFKDQDIVVFVKQRIVDWYIEKGVKDAPEATVKEMRKLYDFLEKALQTLEAETEKRVRGEMKDMLVDADSMLSLVRHRTKALAELNIDDREADILITKLRKTYESISI